MPRKKSLIAQALAEPAPIVYEFPPVPDRPRDITPVVLTFPLPTKPESYNRTAGKHWTAAGVAKSKWVNAAVRACLEAADNLAPFRGHRVEITVAIPFPDKRRRDPHNYTPTVVKPVVDGIVRSGAVVPDDNSTWVSVADPVAYVSNEVRVRIRIAEPEENPREW